MPGFMPGIHVLNNIAARKTWMAGTSPAMTMERSVSRLLDAHLRGYDD
jgi:hypothetical protein